MAYKRKFGKYGSHETILRLIGTSKGEKKSVLDLGASDGVLYEELVSRGFEVTCVDLEEHEKITIPYHDYIQCNLEEFNNLELNQKFDYIILADVIEHLRGAKELLAYLTQYLKDDGKVIISVPNIAIWVYRLSLLFGKFDYTPKGIMDETHVRFYTKKTFLNLMNQANLEIEKLAPTSIPFEELIKNKFLSNLIEKTYYLFAMAWNRMFAYQFVARLKHKS